MLISLITPHAMPASATRDTCRFYRSASSPSLISRIFDMLLRISAFSALLRLSRHFIILALFITRFESGISGSADKIIILEEDVD